METGRTARHRTSRSRRRPRRALRQSLTSRCLPPGEYGAASNYGFVQFREVPNGAAVDLDQRPWVRSPGLENRWLAIPAGAHTITVRAAGYAPTDRRIDVAGGRQQIVRVGSLRALSDYRDDS